LFVLTRGAEQGRRGGAAGFPGAAGAWRGVPWCAAACRAVALERPGSGELVRSCARAGALREGPSREEPRGEGRIGGTGRRDRAEGHVGGAVRRALDWVGGPR